jgi:hypothetical protein
MKNEIKDPIASLTDRLRQKARSAEIPFQEILEHYAIAEFLQRLSVSPYCDKFVLKGGLAFLGWGVPLRRPTRDIDLQAYTDNTPDNILAIVRKICAQSIDASFVIFEPATIKAVPINLQADKAGVRVKLTAKLGHIEIPMQIDFSFANVITPGAIPMHYPDPMGGKVAEIYGYPPETSIAEKLEAMMAWGTATGRLKDYFDIWLLSQERLFDGALLLRAIQATFSHRGTSIPLGLPEALSQEFAEQEQKHWTAFLNKFGSTSAEISDFSLVMARLREFILPLLKAAANDEIFHKTWLPEGKWT